MILVNKIYDLRKNKEATPIEYLKENRKCSTLSYLIKKQFILLIHENSLAVNELSC